MIVQGILRYSSILAPDVFLCARKASVISPKIEKRVARTKMRVKAFWGSVITFSSDQVVRVFACNKISRLSQSIA